MKKGRAVIEALKKLADAQRWKPEPIETWEENGVEVKRYPPGWASGSEPGPTARFTRRGKKRD